jgi:hypothetical protein
MSHKNLIYNSDYQEIVAKIDKEVDYIDLNPHSRNIIKDCLRVASNKFGIDVANDLIEEFDLENNGWSKMRHEESS